MRVFRVGKYKKNRLNSNYYKLKFKLGEWSVDNQILKSKVRIIFVKGLCKFIQIYNDGSKKISYMNGSDYNKYPYGVKLQNTSSVFEGYYVTDEHAFFTLF